MTQHFPLAAITDEFSPDIEVAAKSMKGCGMVAAELRMVFGKNIIDLTNEEIERAKAIVASHGLKIISIASPVLKCVLPHAPEVDARFQQDMFASKNTIADQPRLIARAFEIARMTGAGIIRVFSYWRTVDPSQCFDRIVIALRDLAEQAASRHVIIGLENEHACNIATGAETAKVLEAVNHPNLQVVWDPANAYVAGEIPFPDGYRKLPANRIAHVHAKDCLVVDHKTTWGPLGECEVDWKGQIAALVADGYHGYISLETHWPGPDGNKHAGSVICGNKLRELVTA
jgi:sugar phosphate isomerase/epimerase